MVELIRTYSKQYIITKHHDPNKTTRDHSNQRICSRDCMTSPFSNITFDNRVGVDHDHAMQNQNSTTKVDAHDINLTTSLRRTLSPVCQQNVKRCNKCRKHSWRIVRPQRANFVVFCAYFGNVNFDDFGQKKQNASQDAHLGRLGFPKMYKSLLCD